MLDTKEGWQAARNNNTRVYHYIRETFSLCGKLGFYVGDLIPYVKAPRGNEDCAACYRKLQIELKRADKLSNSTTKGGET